MEPALQCQPDPSDTVETGPAWQHLSPVAILYFTISNIKSLIQGWVYVIPALAYSYSVTDVFAHPLFWPAALAFSALLSVNGVVNYWFYLFRVYEGHVEIRQGVFHRRHTNLPFSRIQNVTITRPFYYRLTDTVIITLDTAGSADDEASIVAVSQHYARTLQEAVTSSEHDVTETASVSNNESQGTLLIRRTLKDLTIHGITNNRVWILLGVFAPFHDTIIDVVYGWLPDWERVFPQEWKAAPAFSLSFLLIAGAFILVFVAFLTLLSVLGAIVSLYGYTLHRKGERYIRHSGLFTRHEKSMRKTRIQMVRAKQDWLDVLLRRVNLYFEQNTAYDDNDSAHDDEEKLLIPSVTLKEAAGLCQEAMPYCDYQNAVFTRPEKRYLWHSAIKLAVLALVLIVIVSGVREDIADAALVTGGFCIAMAALYLRWWRWGIAETEEYIIVRKGLVGVTYQCFPRYKVQQVCLYNTPMMAHHRLSNIRLVLASGEISVPYLTRGGASVIANSTLHSVYSDGRSWM